MTGLEDDGVVTTPWIATLTGFALMTAGLFSAGAGVQLLTLLVVWGWAKVLPPLLLLLGVAAMGVGGVLTRGRTWAAVGGAVLGGALALVGLVWVVWALMYGFFAPLPLFAALLSVGAGLLGPFAVWPCWRVEQARRKLLEA